jgi:hypothetical protein
MKKLLGLIIKVVVAVVVAIFAIISIVAGNIVTFGMHDYAREADVIIVLGAGLTSHGKPSPVFAERINHGIRLYQEGYAKKLMFTGGFGEGSHMSDSQSAKNYAIAHGVAEEDILLEERSKITEENLYYAHQVMQEEGMQTALLVSDPLHMKRAVAMAKDLGMEVYSSPTKTTRYVSLRTQLPFLAKETVYYIGYCVFHFLGRGAVIPLSY